MKVVVQNGARHALSRSDVEAMIRLFPATWAKAVSSIVLYQTAARRVYAEYYPKSHTIALYWPASTEHDFSLVAAVDELLIALASASETGDLPKKLSESRRTTYLNDLHDVRARCLEVIDAQL